jgi:hypothetical protein
MDELDLNKFKYTKVIEVDSTPKLPRHKKGEKFLKGPVPVGWLAQAAHLPGKAFVVAIFLWFIAGMKKMPTLKVSQKALRAWGLNRKTVYRALDALEEINLISVIRHPGRNSIVRIIGIRERETGSTIEM